MAELTVTDISEDGSNVTFASAAAGGDTAANDGRVMLLVDNGSGSSITVTVSEQVSGSVQDSNYGDLAKSDATISVPNGECQPFGPFSPQAFNDSNGDINISYSATASVTVAAFKPSDLKR